MIILKTTSIRKQKTDIIKDQNVTRMTADKHRQGRGTAIAIFRLLASLCLCSASGYFGKGARATQTYPVHWRRWLSVVTQKFSTVSNPSVGFPPRPSSLRHEFRIALCSLTQIYSLPVYRIKPYKSLEQCINSRHFISFFSRTNSDYLHFINLTFTDGRFSFFLFFFLNSVFF